MKDINNYIIEKLHINKDYKSAEIPSDYKRISNATLYKYIKSYGEITSLDLKYIYNEPLEINGRKIIGMYAHRNDIHAYYEKDNGSQYEFTITADAFSDEDLYLLHTFLEDN